MMHVDPNLPFVVLKECSLAQGWGGGGGCGEVGGGVGLPYKSDGKEPKFRLVGVAQINFHS